MPRYFTLQQAEKLLPAVAAAIREAISLKARYDQGEAVWGSFSQRVTLMGGVRVDRAYWLEQKTSRAETARGLKRAIEKVQEFGCVVKDLDIGLIDFPTLLRVPSTQQEEEVYLCWKLGETGIQFWHGVNEGFRGRKAIDQEFLERHRGELPD
jgi:hypothetical protein